VPHERIAAIINATISWNYTTILSIIFLAIAAFLLVWFFRTGGLPMVRMIGGSPEAGHQHNQSERPVDHESRARQDVDE